jgi:error-prone DNA polymerase
VARYAELHAHTNYSFLDGASDPYDLVAHAAELGYTALAVTDHDGFRGAAKVHVAAREIGLPIVYGTEVGMGGETRDSEVETRDPRPETRDPKLETPASASPPRSGGDASRLRRGRIRRMHGSKPTDRPETDHLILLAPDPAGYAALSRFVTRGQFRGQKDRPRYDYADLDTASRDGKLVALTGCRDGAVPRAAQAGDLAEAMTAAARLRDIFPGRLFIELTHHGMPDDDERNDLLFEVSRRLHIPYVATNNVH